jgi:hypothetical protein
MKITDGMNLKKLAELMGPDASMENADEMKALLLEGGFLDDDTAKVPRREWAYNLKLIGLKLPPNLRGQGRKALSEQGSVVLQARVTPQQKAKFERLGGGPWLRDRIEKAKE